MKIIEVKNLAKTYKVKEQKTLLRDLFAPKFVEVHAVNGINFGVNKGEAVALLGPNGAGKTTTMKMLSGLVFPTDGSVKVLGYNPFDRKKEFLKKIGLVMGNKTSLEWDLTGRQCLLLNKKIYDISNQKFINSVKNIAELLSVDSLMDVQIRKLSLGQRMKMELMASILHEPEVLFLDEPTIGLDVMAKKRVRKFLREIQKNSNITILLTSHDMDDVEKVTDRVIVINEGSLVYDDSMEKLLYKYKNKKYLTLVFTKKVNPAEIKRYGEVVERRSLSYTIEIDSKNQSKVITEIMDNLPVDDIDIVHIPLEEIIEDMFSSKHIM